MCGVTIEKPQTSAGGHSSKKFAVIFVGLILLALTITVLSADKGEMDYHWTRGMIPIQEPPSDSLTPSLVLSVLNGVLDPELDISVVDLGLIQDVSVDSGKIRVDMTLTSPHCPMAEKILQGIKEALFQNTRAESLHLHLSFDPPWTVDRISTSARNKLFGVAQGSGEVEVVP